MDSYDPNPNPLTTHFDKYINAQQIPHQSPDQTEAQKCMAKSLHVNANR